MPTSRLASLDDEPEGAELSWSSLSFAIALAELTALAVEDGSGQRVAAFGAVELDEDAAAVGLVVDVANR
jgi:hypothetical protein